MKTISYQNKICFKSGLSNKILQKEKSINPEYIQNIFSNQYNIESDFLYNKSGALANKYCLSILTNLSKKLNLNLSLPPAIYIYKRQQLCDKTLADNFCIQETNSILENDYPFLGRSLFFKDFNSLQEIDAITETKYKKNKISSSHFLSPFIHELLHSFHLDMIYKKYGYNGECKIMQKIYPCEKQKEGGIDKLKELEIKKLSDKENEIVLNTIGEYATLPINQYQEIFSEAFTKFICESLNGIELTKNPLEQLFKESKEFQRIINKILLIK